MRATLRLGRIKGIELGANWSVLVIGGLLAFGLSGGVVDGVLWAVVVPTVLVFLGSLLAHELGHSLVAQHSGMRVRSITLWMLGGVAQLEGRMPSAGAEFRIAAAGPAVSYLLAGLFFVLARAGETLGAPALVAQALGWLAFVNIVLGTFNLIPAAPLDGGRILASAVWGVTGDRTRAEVVATRVGQAFGGLLVAAGVLGPFVGVPYVSLWTALMGLFVYRTATVELAHARLEGTLGDRTVGEVMTPRARDDPRVDDRAVLRRRAPHRAGAPPRVAGARLGRHDPRRGDPRPARTRAGRAAHVDPGAGRRRCRCRWWAPRRRTSRCSPPPGRFGLGNLGLLLVFEAGRLAGIVTGTDLARTDPRVVPSAVV